MPTCEVAFYFNSLELPFSSCLLFLPPCGFNYLRFQKGTGPALNSSSHTQGVVHTCVSVLSCLEGNGCLWTQGFDAFTFLSNLVIVLKVTSALIGCASCRLTERVV